MRRSNKLAVVVELAALLAAGAAYGGILFQENFESGSNPFGFDAFQDDAATAAGKLAVVGPPRGRVWLTVLPPGRQQGLIGHRLVLKESPGSRLHWAAYVRFGHGSDRTQWLGAGETAYQLALPVVSDRDGRPKLIGRFRQADRAGRFGLFELVTADGRVHRPTRGKLLVANRWYAIEFGVEDRGKHDRVRIWIDNGDEAGPDYDLAGGDMVDAAEWRPGLRFDHGYVAHDVPAESYFYYDVVTIADGFIGLPVPPAVRPAAPGGLQVE